MRSKSILVVVLVLFVVSPSAFAGYLYGTSGNDLLRIDLTDYSLEILYTDGAANIAGGLAYIPEPTTLLLLALGGLALRRRHS